MEKGRNRMNEKKKMSTFEKVTKVVIWAMLIVTQLAKLGEKQVNKYDVRKMTKDYLELYKQLLE